MINLPYSLIIEATDDPNFFGFYSPDLPGFTGVGHSIEDCIYKALHGMDEHLEVMAEEGLTPPPQNKNNEIIIRNAVRAAS
jgi:predicted RNase H-like HicB family nuclease